MLTAAFGTVFCIPLQANKTRKLLKHETHLRAFAFIINSKGKVVLKNISSFVPLSGLSVALLRISNVCSILWFYNIIAVPYI